MGRLAEDRRQAWYVSYGSNMCGDRLQAYLHGSPTPVGGASAAGVDGPAAVSARYGAHRGCADASPPTDDRWLELDHAVSFRSRSLRWGGGVAFLDLRPTVGVVTPARAWRLRLDQVLGILGQEARLPADPPPSCLDGLAVGSALVIGGGWYDTVLRLPDLGLELAVAITTSQPLEPAAPTAAYRATIDAGLVERPSAGATRRRQEVVARVRSPSPLASVAAGGLRSWQGAACTDDGGGVTHGRRSEQRPAVSSSRTGGAAHPGRGVDVAAVMTWEEAVAQVTAPGERFELGEVDIDGVTQTVFTQAPPTLGAVFGTWAARGDALFLVYEDERRSFAEVADEVAALGAALVGRYGVRRGDRVAIAMRNLPEWVITFAAVTSIGGVAVSLNGWWTADELEYGLEDSGASVVVADPERVELTRDACTRLSVSTIGVRLDPVDDAPAGVDRWEDVVVLGAELPLVDVDPRDDATILYTSGTTGRPKGAVSTHRAVVQSLMSFGCRATVQRVRRPDEAVAAAAQPPVFILVVPLFHVTGCVAVFLSCAAAGVPLVMMRRWSPERALELIERERVTNFVGVPTQSWDLMESPRFAQFDTSSLVSVGGGGAPSPPALVARVEAGFKRGRPSIGYGMTETNAFGPQNSGDDYVTHPTSTGRSLPTLRVEVRDADRRALPVGQQGEIWFKGPSIIRGYWNRPEATAETIDPDGWLRTGDVGRIDAEGFVYVEDRAKDLVLRAGENVSCAEVEAAVYEHPDVYEAAVFGVPHERLGEEVAVAVVVREGHDLDPEELKAHVGQRLASFKVPSRVMITVERLPRNAAGKILKRDLRDQVATEHG